MPKVSIIIAAYNINKYIGRCLDSVINQTIKDIEIIVVNDGSTDLTLNVIQDKAKNEDRIIIVNQKNKGLIEARKSGFEKSNGDYVLFIDGDDWIDVNTIQILYDKASELNLDIVCYKFLWTYNDGRYIKSSQDKCGIVEDLLKALMLNEISPCIWSKFIKRKFIIDNSIEFPSKISYAEDLAFSCSLATYNPKTYILDEYLYYYFQREDSLSNKVSNSILDIEKATVFIKEQLIKKDLLEKYKDEYEYMAYIHNYFTRRHIIYDSNEVIGEKLYHIWKDYNIKIYKNRYYKKLFKNESKRSKIYSKLFEKYRFIGIMYNKIK